MTMLIHEALLRAARNTPAAPALVYQEQRLDYAGLAAGVCTFATALRAPVAVPEAAVAAVAPVESLPGAGGAGAQDAEQAATSVAASAGLGPGLGLQRGERLAVYLEKRIETVVALFGAAAAGAVFVPVNPLLKDEQVAYILADCNVRVLVTSAERLRALLPVLPSCPDLRTIVVTGAAELPELYSVPGWPALTLHRWHTLQLDHAGAASPLLDTIDADLAAILYTSGSTGRPKGVMISHRNLVCGAASVVDYLENTAADRVLAVLPLSFDYGLSQLTTAFEVGACVVLINHLFPRDIVRAVVAERITGLAAVPPLWIQLVQQDWPQDCSLRYLTNSGGAMSGVTVGALQKVLPRARLFLMYGLTEAFRSTFLPPEQLATRPASMGRAIPNAEVLVVRADGSICDDEETGELVHRGALVSLGYWNDREKTSQRFRPAPACSQLPGMVLPEIAVWSGDLVRRDSEGYLYFVGRNDDMIKVSGYRVSPGEIEEILHGCKGVREAAVFGLEHPAMGQAVVAVVVMDKESAGLPATAQQLDQPDQTGQLAQIQQQIRQLLEACRRRLPVYMVPAHLEIRAVGLPRNPNGKIDRKALQLGMAGMFMGSAVAVAPSAANT